MNFVYSIITWLMWGGISTFTSPQNIYLFIYVLSRIVAYAMLNIFMPIDLYVIIIHMGTRHVSCLSNLYSMIKN